ncbi:MAG: hypothetical protein ABSF83_08380 [Nitrososphaerales archaeon]|jgi:hypothetical protein
MAENRAVGKEAAGETPATAEPSTPATAKERLVYICESCGPEMPVDQVYSCTLCTLNYCVKHLAPMAHYCFGALGKPQTIGVSG